MGKKTQQVPPLRFASVGMTISFELRTSRETNKVTDSRDDKGEGNAHLSTAVTEGWTEPQVFRNFHHLGWAEGSWPLRRVVGRSAVSFALRR